MKFSPRNLFEIDMETKENFDLLKGTKYDEIFGVNCPMRNLFKSWEKDKKEVLDEWIDDNLREWLYVTDYLKKIRGNISLDKDQTKIYFEKNGVGGIPAYQEEIRKLDSMEKKYDIPQLAQILREYNNSKMCAYLIEGGNSHRVAKPKESLDSKYVYELLSNGGLKVVKWLSENGLLASKSEIAIIGSVIKGGSLDAVKYIIEKIFGNTQDMFNKSVYINFAISYDQFHILKWLIESGDESLKEKITFRYAVQKKSLDMVKSLVEKEYPICDNAIKIAVENNDIEMIKYLLSIGCSQPNIVYKWAIESDHMDIVKLLQKRN